MQNRINGIKKYLLRPNNQLLIANEKFEVFLDNIFLCKMQKTIFYLYGWRNFIVIGDIYGKFIFIDESHESHQFMDGTYYLTGMIDNYMIMYTSKDKKELSYIYDFEQDKKVLEVDFRIGDDIFENKIYFTRSNDLISFGIEEKAILWQFSLSSLPPYKDIWGKEKPAEVIQILGIYENVLWVHIAGFRLIGLDVKNGELLHNFENVLIGGYGNNFLDEETGVIKILGNTYYGEFCLSTLSLIREEKIRCSGKIKVREAHLIKGDKNLYFCGYHNESLHPNAFGIFDTEKSEIIWYETTKDDLGYFYNPPQASEKLLAILDDKQNLLIYERD